MMVSRYFIVDVHVNILKMDNDKASPYRIASILVHINYPPPFRISISPTRASLKR